MLARKKGAADVFLETEWKIFHMSSPDERQRAVEPYFSAPITTAQVVEHLEYPTKQYVFLVESAFAMRTVSIPNADGVQVNW